MIDKFSKEKLGKRIKQLRLARGFSQDGLCDKLDINSSSLSNFENGKNAPSLETFVKITNALDVEPNEIFEYSHYRNAEELEQDVINKYRSLTKEKQIYFYRLLCILKEMGI